MATSVNVDPGADWYDTDSIAFQIDGNDLVHIAEIDDDGWATVRVFESTHPDARVLFEGRVNVTQHLRDNPEGDEG